MKTSWVPRVQLKQGHVFRKNTQFPNKTKDLDAVIVLESYAIKLTSVSSVSSEISYK